MSDVGEIANAVKPLIDNLAKLTGPMSEELGQYFGDKVRAFRQRNITTIVDNSIKRLEDAGKPANPVPPRLLLPILDGASLEDNPTLQEMWSGLLASASDQTDNMSPSYVDTLRALTPIEARSISVLYDFLTESAASTLGSDEDVSYRLAMGLGLMKGRAIAPQLIIETLERLGLIRREYVLSQIPKIGDKSFLANFSNLLALSSLGSTVIGEPYFNIGNQTTEKPEPLPKVIYDLVFTSYGIQFMRACRGPALSTQAANEPTDVHSLRYLVTGSGPKVDIPPTKY